jgi:crotonobetainyl-CoA:carnitine CoA-transferase CaiB-like acyl-CoA transferase
MTGRQSHLDDLLVIDLSRAIAGPHAAMMLADQGARVIKIESPYGDDSRSWGPPFVGDPSARQSTYFLSANRNKESVVLDLKTTDGLAVLSRLVRRADILIENFRAGVLERLGYGITKMRAENPRLIVLSTTGFGHAGAMAQRAGYDQIVQGESGLMSLTGPDMDHPTKYGVPIVDLLAAMNGAFGVMAALHRRTRTGQGGVVRTSLFASAVGAHCFQGTRWTVAHDLPMPTGNHHAAIAPYGCFRCKDGQVQIAVGSERLWQALRDELGLDATDPRWQTNSSRMAHRDELIAALEGAFGTWTRAEVVERCTRIGIPAGEIKTLDEVYASRLVQDNDLLVEYDQPQVGRVSVPGPPLAFDGSAGVPHTHAPVLGEHTQAVLAWLDSS